ncbi:hypothetical protein [Hoylesella shahii]|jgi:hypothetical protein
MMKQLKKYFFAAIFLLTLATTAQAKLVQTKVYIFGMAASFNDSTSYITDVQEVDAWINDKGNFLYSRENYSYQLRDFLQSQGFVNPTCITCFALSRKKAEKKYATLLKKNAAKGDANLRYLNAKDFKYAAVAPEK